MKVIIQPPRHKGKYNLSNLHSCLKEKNAFQEKRRTIIVNHLCGVVTWWHNTLTVTNEQ
jgi:hypothetical protein